MKKELITPEVLEALGFKKLQEPKGTWQHPDIHNVCSDDPTPEYLIGMIKRDGAVKYKEDLQESIRKEQLLLNAVSEWLAKNVGGI